MVSEGQSGSHIRRAEERVFLDRQNTRLSNGLYKGLDKLMQRPQANPSRSHSMKTWARSLVLSSTMLVGPIRFTAK